MSDLKFLKYALYGMHAGGTRFTSSYLTDIGIPCTHESIQGLRNGEWWINKNHSVADSSCLVMRWIDRAPKHVELIVILRNPISVLNSHLKIQFDFGRVVSPDVEMAEIMNSYNEALNHPRMAFQFRLEDQLPELCEYFHKEYLEPDGSQETTRHNGGRLNLRYSDLKRYSNYQKFCDFATKLGYDVK